MLRMVATLICSGILLLDFGIAGSVQAKSVDDYIKALTPESSTMKHRGLGGVKQSKQNPQAALYLQFGLNSANLTTQAKAELQKLGRALKKEKLRQYIYRLEGHTCDLGSNAHNMALSQQRAQAVKQYLVRTFNLSANQFKVAWFGETKPLAPNTDEAARRKNRRVIIQNTLRKLDKSSAGKSAALQIKRFRNGIEETVKDGEIIRQDDQYAVEFEAGEDPYVYIFQLDSKGKLTPIFPNSKISSITNPVTPGTFYRIPERGKWFYLDENKGNEQVIFLAQQAPLPDPIATAKDVITGKISASGKRGLGGIRKKPPASAKSNTPQPKTASAVSSRPEVFVLIREFMHQ